MFWFFFFYSGAGGMLSPLPGIELAFSALEGEVLTTGLSGKSQGQVFSDSIILMTYHKAEKHGNSKCSLRKFLHIIIY